MSTLATLEELFKSNAIRLTKIPRGYYSQGLALIKASRRLHSSDEDITCLNSERLTELRRITDHVGVFLKATTTDNNSKAPEIRDREINDLLMAAVEVIDQYQTRYQISPKWTKKETDFRGWICAVKEDDGKAAKHMEVIQAAVDKKVVSDSSVLVWRLTAKSDQQKRWFSGIMPKKVEINRWPEDQLTVTVNSKGAIICNAEHRVYNIEGSASLDDVLLRLRMQKALSMSSNPQFYKYFPLRRQDLRKYGEERSQKWKIFPFESWITINEALKALKDVKMDLLQLVFDNTQYRSSVPNSPITNIWNIEGGEQVFKGIFGALELYDRASRRIEAAPMPGAYPNDLYPPNQNLPHQPSATPYPNMPQPMVMPATPYLRRERPSQSDISTVSQPSVFSDDSSSLPPPPPPSVDSMRTDSTLTFPVPTVPGPSEPAEPKKGLISRGLGTFRGGKKEAEKKRKEQKTFPLLPNQQESQVAAPSSSSTFLRPAVAETRVRKRDILRQMLDPRATKSHGN